MISRFQPRRAGFSSVELLLALAIGAALIGAAAIAYGSIVRSQPRVGSSVVVTLGNTKVMNFYGLNQATVQASVAPSYGALAQAEDMRERFLEDTLAATAVYCLARTDINTFRPTTLPYNPATNPATDIVLDSSNNFRQFMKNRGFISVTSFVNTPYFDVADSNASIFVLGYSSVPNQLAVNAIYEIDVVRPTSPTTGYYASVRRYVGTALTQYYDVYYPPPPPPPNVPGVRADTENFAPIWVSFDRLDLGNKPVTVALDRFKKAREKPFHFIWWPDPAARSLGMQFTTTSNSTYFPFEARQAYNHMAGRTSFMFTVPVFPSL